MRLQSLYNLKNILSTGDVFERILSYAKLVEGTFNRANAQSGFNVKRIVSGLEAPLKKEEEMLSLSDELQNHYSNIEETMQSRKLDAMILSVAQRRVQLEKMICEILNWMTAAIRSFTSAYQNFNVMTEGVLDMLDEEQVSLINQTYGTCFNHLERTRSTCSDAIKLYSSSPILSKIFGSFSDFCFSLFSNLGINASEIANEVNHLNEFNVNFHPMQKLFDKTIYELNHKANDATIAKLVQEFGEYYNRANDEYQKLIQGIDNISKLFLGANKQELIDGYEYMNMIKEVFSAFSKILDQRVRSGYADPQAYKELDEVLADKPDKLIEVGQKFKLNFS